MEEASAWQSPSHYHSLGIQECGQAQSVFVEPYTHDYRRWSLGSHIKQWEDQYARAMYDVADQDTCVPLSLLTSSGMAAVRLAVAYITEILSGIDAVLYVHAPYFELERFFGTSYQQFRVEIADIPAVTLRRKSLIVVEPVTNSAIRKSVDVQSIVEIMSKLNRKAALLIDRTILGSLYQPFRAPVQQNTANLHVICIESLLKNCQYGLELGQGGIFTTLCNPDRKAELYTSLSLKRAINGLLPADIHFSAYLPIDRTLTDRRLYLQSRNAALIARSIDLATRNTASRWIVHYPDLDKHYNFSSYGGLISVINKSQKTQSYYDEIVAKCVQAAAAEGVILNVGLSFGFNTTRISSCIDKFDRPDQRFYLRISTGTEDIIDAMKLACLLSNVLARS